LGEFGRSSARPGRLGASPPKRKPRFTGRIFDLYSRFSQTVADGYAAAAKPRLAGKEDRGAAKERGPKRQGPPRLIHAIFDPKAEPARFTTQKVFRETRFPPAHAAVIRRRWAVSAGYFKSHKLHHSNTTAARRCPHMTADHVVGRSPCTPA